MILTPMLPSEKLELAIYKHVRALEPLAADVSLPFLSQTIAEKDQGRIIERLTALDDDNRIRLTKLSAGSFLPRAQFNNDPAFFNSGSFLIKIAPHGRKYFEELEQRAEQEKKPMTARKSSEANIQLIPPKKAIEILQPMIHNSAYLSGEAFGSPKREEWTHTAEGALARSFAPGSRILTNFGAARAIAFSVNDSDEELRRIANENLAAQVAVLKSAIVQLGWELGAEETVTPTRQASASGVDLQIFISHSSKDRVLAEALTDLLKSALGLLSSQIRCSSVDGHRLPVGVDTQSKLRAEVNAAKVVIGLVTPSSLVSSYVMFELGARWGSNLFLAPLLAGVNANTLSGPLGLLNALSADHDSQLHQLLGDVAEQLEMPLQRAESYVRHIELVKRLAVDTPNVAAEHTEVRPLVTASPEFDKTIRPVYESEAQRKRRAILEWKGKTVTLSQMATGRAVTAVGPRMGSSSVVVVDCTEYVVKVGSAPGTSNGFSRSISLDNITIGFDDQNDRLELQERYA
jgi:TIR domain-containing protein